MELIKTKVCIIGAGPGGLTTSLYLAKLGISSVVVDKDQFPRNKACGDNISGNTIRTLYEFDPAFVEKLKGKAQIVDLQGVIVYAPNGHQLEIDYLSLEKGTDLPSCYSIKRIDLDDYLINEAKKNEHIQVVEQFYVHQIDRLKHCIRLYNKDRSVGIEAQLVIAATGSNGNIPEKLGAGKRKDKHYALGVRAYYENVKYPAGTHYSELFVTKKLMPGGLYITPLKDGLVNVNVGMRSDVVKKRQVNLVKLMEETLHEHPVLGGRFSQAKRVGKIEGSGLSLGTQKQPISGDRFMLVGDAAGLIDLLSANGIPQALASAKIAAEMASKCIAQNDFSAKALKNYDQRVYKRVEHYLKLGKMVAPLMGYPMFNWFTISLMNFITKKFNRNDQLRNLMYDNQVGKTLRKPSFYYKALFGVKNKEAL